MVNNKKNNNNNIYLKNPYLKHPRVVCFLKNKYFA